MCSKTVCIFFYDHLSSQFEFYVSTEDQAAQEAMYFPLQFFLSHSDGT